MHPKSILFVFLTAFASHSVWAQTQIQSNINLKARFAVGLPLTITLKDGREAEVVQAQSSSTVLKTPIEFGASTCSTAKIRPKCDIHIEGKSAASRMLIWRKNPDPARVGQVVYVKPYEGSSFENAMEASFPIFSIEYYRKFIGQPSYYEMQPYKLVCDRVDWLPSQTIATSYYDDMIANPETGKVEQRNVGAALDLKLDVEKVGARYEIKFADLRKLWGVQDPVFNGENLFQTTWQFEEKDDLCEMQIKFDADSLAAQVIELFNKPNVSGNWVPFYVQSLDPQQFNFNNTSTPSEIDKITDINVLLALRLGLANSQIEYRSDASGNSTQIETISEREVF